MTVRKVYFNDVAHIMHMAPVPASLYILIYISDTGCELCYIRIYSRSNHHTYGDLIVYNVLKLNNIHIIIITKILLI
jgi:hypothetical protein